MRTAIAQKKLSSNTRKMNKLNKRMREIARRMSQLKPTKENERLLEKLMIEAKENRAAWHLYQDEITLLVGMERHLFAE